ncbi:putative baseplate assembly protein [Segeticoccus rhizosphaerae]|uniref:putative baseplate assembly protein n=1 Tax=Segeticoccus rhizosphaerae TaxID=1104777 RepID=UPI001396A221|nr:putative baseplate assembly protein [Segeticoccus rhizosphaerae]
MTPHSLYQRPGLPTLGYRIGTHQDFLTSMRARLAAYPELQQLTARTTDDPSIALLDCWAVVADIVTFYAERARDEASLGTAVNPESLVRLGRLVGYRPRPSLGASGHLAFTMDPGSVGTIPAGTSAKSVPGPGELPQTFEVSETLDARADWNQLEVRRTRPFPIQAGTLTGFTELTFDGSSLNLKAGDLLVFDLGDIEQPRVREIASVAPDFQADRTLVRLVPDPGTPVGLELALGLVKAAVADAGKTAASAFEQELGVALTAAGQDLDEPTTQMTALATLHRLVAESRAFADAGRLSKDESRWVSVVLASLEEAVSDAAPLVAASTRAQSPELAYLERLAIALTCPSDGEAERRDRADTLNCARATPLLATAAALQALRRPPSRPPKLASDLAQASAESLDPGSSSLVTLLAGADPRLAGTLAQAIGQQAVTAPPLTAHVIALRTKAGPVPDEFRSDTQLSIDGTPDNLVPGGWLVSRERGTSGEGATDPASTHEFVTRIASAQHYVRIVTIAEGTSARVPTTAVTTTGPFLATGRDVDLDDVTVWFGDQPLSLSDEPIPDPVRGGEIALAQSYPGLMPGRRLVVTGERRDIPGVTGIVASELTMVGAVEQRIDLTLPGDVTRPVLVLATPLAYEYVRDTVVIQGNVAAATQGETRSEVLGSGSATQAGQSFSLKQPTDDTPLTFLPAVSPEGFATTLTVRVDQVRWHPTEILADSGPRDHSYAEEAGSGPAVSVRFGDGVHGSRLPNGVENVTASYRVGAGRAGNVGPGRVQQLTSRPLGVAAVSNPLPMTGGAPGDTPADNRDVIPLRTLALDRLVSVADYADFAAAHAGIAQAAAARLYDGRREVVHVTIATLDDAALDPGDLLFTALEGTLTAYGDPHLPVRLDIREELWLVLSAGLKVDPDHLYDDVATHVRARLLDVAGFRAARLAEPVYLSRLVAAAQQTPGVDYIDVDVFGALPSVADPVQLLSAVTALAGVADMVPARRARRVHEEYVVGQDPTGADDTLTTIALRHGRTVDELIALNPQLRSSTLTHGQSLTVADGLRPAQLACFNTDVPQTLILRRIP